MDEKKAKKEEEVLDEIIEIIGNLRNASPTARAFVRGYLEAMTQQEEEKKKGAA